jgi:hypothetical protein
MFLIAAVMPLQLHMQPLRENRRQSIEQFA